MLRNWLAAAALTFSLALPRTASAVASAELYQTQSLSYGRFEARTRFASGDGIISSFFLWKPGSEMPGTFWNELDFEKLGADCRMQTNPLYGTPVVDRGQVASVAGDLCNEYHTYAFEWTPDYIAWLIDGVEVRREAGETAAAFAANAASGMQIHFNIWPGDASFGGNFNPASLPVHQYISWVQYSAFTDGAFTLQWREDFTSGVLPSGWATGNWASPKNLSTHAPANVGFVDEAVVLSLTSDTALGFNGQLPPDGQVPSGSGGSGSGSGGTGSSSSPAAAGGTSGNPASGAGGTGGTSGAGATEGGGGGPGASYGGSGGGLVVPAAGQGAENENGCSVVLATPRARSGALLLGVAAALAGICRRGRRQRTT